MDPTTFLPKWNHIAVAVVFVSFASCALATLVNTSHSNIRQPGAVIGYYSAKDGLTLTFNPASMDAADKSELAKGFFIVTDDIILTGAECMELKAPLKTKIPKGKYKIDKSGDHILGGIVIHQHRDTAGVNRPIIGK